LLFDHGEVIQDLPAGESFASVHFEQRPAFFSDKFSLALQRCEDLERLQRHPRFSPADQQPDAAEILFAKAETSTRRLSNGLQQSDPLVKA
jgi:hypothetical protein